MKCFKPERMRIRKVIEVEVNGLGQRIRQARKAIAGEKSLRQICDEVGVTPTYWYDLEKETLKGALSVENLASIEIALGVSFGISLDGEA